MLALHTHKVIYSGAVHHCKGPPGLGLGPLRWQTGTIDLVRAYENLTCSISTRLRRGKWMEMVLESPGKPLSVFCMHPAVVPVTDHKISETPYLERSLVKIDHLQETIYCEFTPIVM